MTWIDGRAALVALIFPLVTPAQERLIGRGDLVPGIAPVHFAYEPALNDAGDWATVVQYEGPGPRFALVRNGAVVLKSADVLALERSGKLLVYCTLDDPQIAGTNETALVLIELDGAGAIVAEQVIVHEGALLPGETQPVANVSMSAFDFNAAGDLIFHALVGGKHKLFLNGAVLAESGAPSLIPGMPWGGFYWAALNDAGDYAFKGWVGVPFGATRTMIVKNGEVLVQQGDVLPSTSPHPLDLNFGNRIELGEDGKVGYRAYFGNQFA